MASLAKIGTTLVKGKAGLGSKLSGAKSAVGKENLQNLGTRMTTGKGFGLVLGGAFAAGVANKTVDPAINAANDVAFGDPEADKYFMGSQGLSLSGIIDAKTGSGGGVAGTIGGAAIGGIFGAIGGGAAGSMLKQASLEKGLNVPNNFAKDIPLIGGKRIKGIGGKNILKAGVSAKMGGGALGVAGAIAGAAIGASAMTRGYTNRNKQFFNESPYAKGSAMQASSTQAYGDMVLGMHNSRRG